MNHADIPRGWKRVNDVCIGVPDDAEGWLYTVFLASGQWEAWRGKELLAMNLESMDAAIGVCREDYRRRK